VGCILGELIKSCHIDEKILEKRPVSAVLFPGAHWNEQLRLIVQLVGVSQDDLQEVSSLETRDRLRAIANANQHQQQQWKNTFPMITADEETLLRALLHFSARKRPTAEEALNFVYVEGGYDDEEDEELTLPEFQADYENLKDLSLIHDELNKELEVYNSAAPECSGMPAAASSTSNGTSTAAHCPVDTTTAQTPGDAMVLNTPSSDNANSNDAVTPASDTMEDLADQLTPAMSMDS
jgi:hypothetical protein